MGLTISMALNLILLIAMVATNILALYHLTSSSFHPPNPPKHPPPIPDHLLHHLHTLRASLTRLQHSNPSPSSKPSIPSDLLLYSHLSPIASACHHHPHLLHSFMSYTPFHPCPSDHPLAETLILLGCHPLPRRRCFSPTPPNPNPNPLSPFPPSLPNQNILWTNYKNNNNKYYSCDTFDCLNNLNPDLGFDMKRESLRFVRYSGELDLPISQLMDIARAAGSVLRLGIDVGGGTGTFAARMRENNVTVVTTTMNVVAPYSEAVAMRGLVPLHVPLQQRLPVFDGVVDVVRCGRAVNRWIPVVVMEFLLWDVDRVVRGGGFVWLDRFFGKRVDLEKVYGPLIGRFGYKKVKWAVVNKTDAAGLKNDEVYLTALLQKPLSR